MPSITARNDKKTLAQCSSDSFDELVRLVQEQKRAAYGDAQAAKMEVYRNDYVVELQTDLL